jgi:hypothetical protein
MPASAWLRGKSMLLRERGEGINSQVHQGLGKTLMNKQTHTHTHLLSACNRGIGRNTHTHTPHIQYRDWLKHTHTHTHTCNRGIGQNPHTLTPYMQQRDWSKHTHTLPPTCNRGIRQNPHTPTPYMQQRDWAKHTHLLLTYNRGIGQNTNVTHTHRVYAHTPSHPIPSKPERDRVYFHMRKQSQTE